MSLFHIYFGHVCVCKKYHKMLQYRVCIHTCEHIENRVFHIENLYFSKAFSCRTFMGIKHVSHRSRAGWASSPEENATNSGGALVLCSGKLHCTEGEIATNLPITQLYISDFYDQHGACITFKSLYQNHKAIVIFVRVSQPFSCLLLVLLHT